MNTARITTLCVCLFACFAMNDRTAFGEIVNFESTIDGPSANAGGGTGSTALGSATATLDTETNEFTYSGTFAGLLGNYTVGHFHGDALPTMNAGTQVTLSPVLSPDSRSGTFDGTAILDSDQVTGLSSGLWYINIHSQFDTSGEIRGQVNTVSIPEPCSIGLIGFGLSLAAIRRRRG